MAAPADMTTLDISGKFFLNHKLSDSTDEILRLQGVGWLTRKALSTATIYIAVKHYKDDSGVEHIDIDQTITGGIAGTREERTLDWKERSHEDHIFGAVIGQSRRIKVEDINVEFLKNGWLDTVKQHGAINPRAMSDTAKSGTTWIGDQVWGFEDIDGEKRYTRHIDFIGPKQEKVQARLVYDYTGPV